MTLNVHVAKNTKAIGIRLEHAQLEEPNETLFSTDGNESCEFQVFLPPGPLYAGIEIKAIGHHADTTYLFHTLRIGAAMNISLESPFSQIETHFQETRRFKYQFDKVNWYIPEVDQMADSLFTVHLTPVVFAPLVSSSQIAADTPAIAEHCDCGNDTAGFGNKCEIEMELKTSSTLCLFLLGTKSTFGPRSGTGLGGHVQSMTQWLMDFHISGKSVLFQEVFGHEASKFPFDPEAGEGLHMTFKQRMPLKTLIGMPFRMLIAVTADRTDSEGESLPMSIVPHPPPIRLRHVDFLPPIPSIPEKDYAWCAWNTLAHVSGDVEDERFTVESERIPSETDCTGKLLEGTTFIAKRKDSCDWCLLYTPWAETYDVSIVRSAEKCLTNAVLHGNTTTLERAMNEMFEGAEETKPKCMHKHGLVGEAIRRNNTAAVRIMLQPQNKADPNDLSSLELPLSIAAELGNIEALNLLVEHGARIDEQDQKGETALFRASIHCQLDSMRFLISKGINTKMQSLVPVAKCNSNQTALLAAIINHDPLRKQCHMKGSQLSDIMKVLEVDGKLDKNSCEIGSALLTSIRGEKFAELGQLLSAGVSPVEVNMPAMPGGKFKPIMELALARVSKSFQSDALKVLLHCGASIHQDLDGYGGTPVSAFASQCNPELVKACLEFGANRSDVYAEEWQHCPKEASESIQNILSDNSTREDRAELQSCQKYISMLQHAHVALESSSLKTV